MAASVGLTNYVSGTVTVFVKRKVLECVSSSVRTPPACSNTSRVRDARRRRAYRSAGAHKPQRSPAVAAWPESFAFSSKSSARRRG